MGSVSRHMGHFMEYDMCLRKHAQWNTCPHGVRNPRWSGCKQIGHSVCIPRVKIRRCGCAVGMVIIEAFVPKKAKGERPLRS